MSLRPKEEESRVKKRRKRVKEGEGCWWPAVYKGKGCKAKEQQLKKRDSLVRSVCPTLRRFLYRCFCHLLNSKQWTLNSSLDRVKDIRPTPLPPQVESEEYRCCYSCLFSLLFSAIATHKKVKRVNEWTEWEMCKDWVKRKKEWVATRYFGEWMDLSKKMGRPNPWT